MDPNMVQLLAQVTEMQRKLAEGLQMTNNNLAALVQNSERRQEVMLQAAREGKLKHWDDAERFRSCKNLFRPRE